MEFDGMVNKSKFGVNVIFGVFFVNVKVVVDYVGILFFWYFGGVGVCVVFVLMMNIVNGGEYVDNLVDV